MPEIKERPILFSGPMVRAILEGRKTVTRRVCKPAESAALSFVVNCGAGVFGDEEGEVQFASPHGRPGDRLWVLETWYCDHFEVQRGPYLRPRDMLDLDQSRADGTLVYAADGLTPYEAEQPVWKPSIHMPRWASRILLEITAIHVERLQEITPEQAIAEGVISAERDIDPDGNDYSPCELFGGLWTMINGMESWNANPWVWVVEFKRVMT